MPIELATAAGSLVAATTGVGYLIHLARSSGRDRPTKPKRVEKMVENAPYDHLDKVPTR